jgi:hypothetical protein
MKKIVSILVLLLFTGIVSLVKAQDVIHKTDKSEIRSTVTEVGMNEVKYKLFNDQSGRLYSLAKSEIVMIVYSNGSMDLFNTSEDPGTSTPKGISKPQREPVIGKKSGEPRNYRKGYAGLGIGTAILLSEYSDVEETGLHFNVNAGYLFGRHIGVTASFLLTSYSITDADDINIGIRGGLVGPLITFGPSSRIVEIDLRPTVGLVSGKMSANNGSLKTNSTFALGFGSSVRWNVMDFISISGNVDAVFHGPLDEDSSFTMESFSSAGITLGVNFRF